MNQKEGVFEAVSKVFANEPANGKWTSEQSKAVYALVFAMFKRGEIEYKGGLPDDAKLNKYIPGLVNNWVRKDTRLNGGTKYETKRPGSRTGSGDEMLKNLKLLLAVSTDPDTKAKVQAAIDERITALKPKVEINSAALPESLRHLVHAA